ncbi:hypothetical protein AB0B07_16740 [Streptomyces sioyaensis]|uniref:hypothetical protein n=1 Tax=Streptomyces sioyaensis TaxID=67364 RepID=UPI0033F84ABB
MSCAAVRCRWPLRCGLSTTPSGQHDRVARIAADTAVWPEVERDTVLGQALRANATALTCTAEDALYRPPVRMSRPAPAACRSVLVVAEAGEKVVLVVQVVLAAVWIRPRSTRPQAAPG